MRQTEDNGRDSRGEQRSRREELLRRWSEGDPDAVDELVTEFYEDLRGVARRVFRRWPQGTLQPTAVLHEAFILLRKQRNPPVDEDRLFGLAGLLMQRFLWQYARRHAARAGTLHISLEGPDLPPATAEVPLTLLTELVDELAGIRPRASEVFKLSRLEGLDRKSIAQRLGVTPRTVTRNKQFAEAWIKREVRRRANE